MAYEAHVIEGWIGRKALDADGDKIGTITDVYLDDATGEAEWLTVMTGWFGSRTSFVPIIGVKERGEDIFIPHDRDEVKKAPTTDADGALSVDEEEALYRYYGFAYEPRLRSSAGGAEARQETGSTAVSAEIPPEVAIARLRRREAVGMEDYGFDDPSTVHDAPPSTTKDA